MCSRIAAFSLATAVLLAGTYARAGMCPTVMIILDKSDSMNLDPMNGSSTPTKLEIAKTAIDKLIMQYGDRIPFGFTDFAVPGEDCNQGVEVLVKPVDGTAAAITAAVNAVVTDGTTNTGPAIDAVVKLPEMNDASRPGSYILLVTDGEPNCPGTVGTESTEPAYTVGAIARAATKGIKTFVIGFGALPSDDASAMDMMATAGMEPCTGSGCNGHKYYAAENDAGLQAAIDSISEQIVGEFGGVCDDSCYANGCPNAGEICVNAKCVADPCASVGQTCAPGDYCFTDGTSPGTCTPECPTSCPPGQSCTLAGCAADPCAGVFCNSPQVCLSGACVTPAACSKDCPNNQFCINGQCKDDPCRYIACPMGATCQSLVGTCVASTSGDGTGGRSRSSGGCEVGRGASSLPLGIALLLFMGVVAIRRKQSF